VQLSRGHWLREDRTGAVRTEGWWESATVTWTPAPGPERRVPLLRHAVATAFDAMAPSVVDLAATAAWRWLERRPGTRPALAPAHRALRAAPRELPRSRQSP
jgi:hypothetical protein